MTEEVVAPVVSPVVEAAPTTVVEPSVAVPEVAPVVAPVVEVAPVEAVPVEEVAKPLLAQPEETAPAEGADKPVEEPVVSEEIAKPTYEFKLPEGSQLDNPIFQSFQTKLGEFQTSSKLDQVAVQGLGQNMIDMHLSALKEVVENQNKASWDWFKNRNAEWLEKSKNDQIIGGDNWDGTVSSASQAISLYGGNKAQQMETAKLLQETGVENHPAILRFLSNITKVAAKEGTPVTSKVVPIQKQGIANAMYGNSSKAS